MSRNLEINIYLYAHPQNAREREFNASMLEKGEAIRCRRFEQLLNEQNGFLDKENAPWAKSPKTTANSFRHIS